MEGSEQQRIYDFLKKSKETSISEITKKLGVNYNTVRSGLRQLRDKGLIQRTGRGKYAVK